MIYRFGVFEFRPGAGELFRDGVHVRLEPQPARALTLLLERAGEVVTREELRAKLWGTDTHVDFDRGIAYCIGQIRSALRDQSENPRFLQTLPRRGFRFIAPVEMAPPAGGASLPAPPETARAGAAWRTGRRPLYIAAFLVTLGVAAWAALGPIASRPVVLAVAVFDNETGRQALDPWTTAVADALVVRLTALAPGGLEVIGNAPVLRQPRATRDPAAIRRATGADYLIFGQLQDEGPDVRLITHLIRLDDGTHAWVTRVVMPPERMEDLESVTVDRVVEAARLHLVERRSDAPRSTP